MYNKKDKTQVKHKQSLRLPASLPQPNEEEKGKVTSKEGTDYGISSLLTEFSIFYKTGGDGVRCHSSSWQDPMEGELPE